MTYNQLNCFEAVCKTLSYSKAANQLYISQPAISKSISKLEQELDTTLFVQTAGGLALTPAGELLLDFTQRLRQSHGELLEKLEELKSLRGRTVRLGCPETWNPSFFFHRLEGCFAAVNPGGRLEIEALKLSEMLQRLQTGDLDALISHDFYTPTIPGISSLQLTETGTGILYSREHFPAPPSFRELAGAGFLLYDRDIEKRFGAVIQAVCAPYGMEPRISSKGQIVKALFEVSRGAGVMLFTDWDSVVTNEAYGYLPLEARLPVRLVYFPEKLGPLTRRFIDAAGGIAWD